MVTIRCGTHFVGIMSLIMLVNIFTEAIMITDFFITSKYVYKVLINVVHIRKRLFSFKWFFITNMC